jgi:addiction module HigA family antidote
MKKFSEFVNEQIQPDYDSNVGEILNELLDERSITKEDLAKRMEVPIKTVNAIISNELKLIIELANKLEKALGKPTADLWMKLSENY